MTQIERFKIWLGADCPTDEENLLNELLETAKQVILKRRYPYTEYPVDDSGKALLEARYEDTQLNIAVYLFNKRGAEGETAHSENGVSRSYESAGIPESYLIDVLPKAG